MKNENSYKNLKNADFFEKFTIIEIANALNFNLSYIENLIVKRKDANKEYIKFYKKELNILIEFYKNRIRTHEKKGTTIVIINYIKIDDIWSISTKEICEKCKDVLNSKYLLEHEIYNEGEVGISFLIDLCLEIEEKKYSEKKLLINAISQLSPKIKFNEIRNEVEYLMKHELILSVNFHPKSMSEEDIKEYMKKKNKFLKIGKSNTVEENKLYNAMNLFDHIFEKVNYNRNN